MTAQARTHRLAWLLLGAAVAGCGRSPEAAPPRATAAAASQPPVTVAASRSLLPPARPHPSPPPLRWQLQLFEAFLARYAAEEPAPSPALTADGSTLVTAGGGALFAVTGEGQVRWRRASAIKQSLYAMARGDSTIVVVGQRVGDVELYTQDGLRLAAVVGAATIGGNPACGHEDAVYAPGSEALWAWALAEGESRWLWRTNERRQWYGLAVGADETVYGGIGSGRLTAVRKDGEIRWSLGLGRRSHAAPAIASDGTLYIGDYAGRLQAVSPDGQVLWSYQAPAALRAPPVIGTDGVIYVGSDDNRLHAVTPLGTGLWTFESEGPIRSAAAVAADGTVFVGSNDGRLYALRADGSEKWSFATSGAVASPTLLADGTVVFASGDGLLRAVTDPGGFGLARSAWPKWAADLQNTSRAARR